MTTRKRVVALTLVVSLVLGGCATKGPLHVYSLAPKTAAIRDEGNGHIGDAPSFLADTESLTGFAYDPFTDHFFLRLEPGNKFRVVDRPARAIKREFSVSDMPANGGGDLAIKPRDGHVFALDSAEPRVFEVTRLGKLVRTFSLESLRVPAAAIAYDMTRDQLIVLEHASRNAGWFDLQGRRQSSVTLDRDVVGGLAFDSDAREIYAALRGPLPQVGVFDMDGRLRRTMPAAGPFFDVGQRSLIRVF